MVTTLQRRHRRRCGRRQTRRIHRRLRPRSRRSRRRSRPGRCRTARRRCSSRSTGPTPQCRFRRRVRRLNMKMMNRMNKKDPQGVGEVHDPNRRAPAPEPGTAVGTSVSWTPRPSAMRLMMRVAPARRPAPYCPCRKAGRMALANRLSGEAVGHESLEAVSDLDPDLAVLDRDDNQQAVVLAALADAAALILEHLDGVFPDVGIRLKRGHRRDDDDVAAGALQRLDASIELALARVVDDSGEVVDRRAEEWRCRLARGRGPAERRMKTTQTASACLTRATRRRSARSVRSRRRSAPGAPSGRPSCPCRRAPTGLRR